MHLGWENGRFYVNSATGWSVDRVDAWARRHLGSEENWDGSVPSALVASVCGSGSILGDVAGRVAVEQLGYQRDAARAIWSGVSSGTSWHGLPYVPSQEVLQAGVEQHQRRVSGVRRKVASSRWKGRG